MAVLGVGWVLIAQVVFVVLIVGIGGQAVLVSVSSFAPSYRTQSNHEDLPTLWPMLEVED